MSSPESEHLVNVLRSLREEDVAGELAEVRGRVMAAIEGRKPSFWFALRWRYALAPAAAALALAAVLIPRPDVPAPPAAPALRLPAPAIAKSKPAPVLRPAPKPAAVPQEPLLVKMFTDDPDVVIYWLIDAEQGDSL